jgi:hypothetical protein
MTEAVEHFESLRAVDLKRRVTLGYGEAALFSG